MSGISAARLVRASLWAGTIGALAMMPFGAAFRAVGLRVGHYGPKFAETLLGTSAPAVQFVQHFVLGWLSAVPLLLWLCSRPRGSLAADLSWGALYGALYYVAVNSLALPLAYGDPLPWALGLPVILPSLTVHLVFGTAVAWAARHRFAAA